MNINLNMNKLEELFNQWEKYAKEEFLEVIESHDLLSNNTILFLNIIKYNNDEVKYNFYQHIKKNKKWEDIYESKFIFKNTKKEKRKDKIDYKIVNDGDDVDPTMKNIICDMFENIDVMKTHCDEKVNDDIIKGILKNEIKDMGNLIIFFEKNKTEYEIPNELNNFFNKFYHMLYQYMPDGYLFLRTPNPPNNFIWYCQDWFPFYTNKFHMMVNVNTTSEDYGKYAIFDKEFNNKGLIITDFQIIRKIIMQDAILYVLPPEFPIAANSIISAHESYNIIQHNWDDKTHVKNIKICNVPFYPRYLVLYLTLVSNYNTYICYKTNEISKIKISFSIQIMYGNDDKNYCRDYLEQLSNNKNYEFCYNDLMFLMNTDLNKASSTIWNEYGKTQDKIKIKCKEFFDKYYKQMNENIINSLCKYLVSHESLVEEINMIEFEKNNEIYLELCEF
jgi:hypothetical protein